jgi:hypothetical protein
MLMMITGVLFLTHTFAALAVDVEQIKQAIQATNAQWEAVDQIDSTNSMRLGLLDRSLRDNRKNKQKKLIYQ